MKDNQEFINTSVNYLEELEEMNLLKNKGDDNRNKITQILHDLQDTIQIKEKEIPSYELLEKLEEIEGLLCDMAINTKREYFKLGFQMEKFINANGDLKYE